MLSTEAGAVRFLKRNFLKSSEIPLGSAVFDLRTGRLKDRSGCEIRLRHRSREVLRELVRRRGEVVTRAALVAAAWEGPAVSDDSVAQCIADIRRALADKQRRVIETVPRRGYRLVAPPGAAPVRPSAAPPEVPAARAPVIAVMPFKDLGISGVRGAVLRAALAEAIITDLARYPEMTVLSRSPEPGLPGLRQIGNAITRRRADYLVTGTLQSDGIRARVGLRLVEARSMACLWVDEVDLDQRELLALSRSIARRVAQVIGVQVIDMAEARLARGEVSAMLTENAARSRMLRFRSEAAFLRNMAEQEVALERFPEAAWGNFGQALALRTGIEAGWLTADVEAASSRAESLAAHALALAPDNYLAHYAVGRTSFGKGETHRGINALERAARLNPSSTLVLSGLVTPHLSQGNTARALEVIGMAERISPPRNTDLSYQKARTLWHMGDAEGALRTLATVPDPTLAQARLLCVVQLDLGHRDVARDTLKPYLAANPNWSLAREDRVQAEHRTPPHLREAWLKRLGEAGMPAR